MEPIEVAAVGEFLVRPDSPEAFDEVSTSSIAFVHICTLTSSGSQVKNMNPGYSKWCEFTSDVVDAVVLCSKNMPSWLVGQI